MIAGSGIGYIVKKRVPDTEPGFVAYVEAQIQLPGHQIGDISVHESPDVGKDGIADRLDPGDEETCAKSCLGCNPDTPHVKGHFAACIKAHGKTCDPEPWEKGIFVTKGKGKRELDSGKGPETVESLFAKVAASGLFNIVLCGGKFGRDISAQVGRVHYGNIRIIGTAGNDPSAAMEYIPTSGEIKYRIVGPIYRRVCTTKIVATSI